MAVGARSTVFTAGMEEGKNQVRAEVITYLQVQLIEDKEGRPDRGSPEYEWAMEFTRKLLAHLDSVQPK